MSNIACSSFLLFRRKLVSNLLTVLVISYNIDVCRICAGNSRCMYYTPKQSSISEIFPSMLFTSLNRCFYIKFWLPLIKKKHLSCCISLLLLVSIPFVITFPLLLNGEVLVEVNNWLR